MSTNSNIPMDFMMVYLAGVHSLGFAIFHIAFPRLFKWNDELVTLSQTNQAIMKILNRRFVYFGFFVAASCFLFAESLLTTPFGRFFLIGMSLFWLGRLIEQFVFLRVSHPMVHLLNMLFILGVLLFAIPVLL